ncbi:MAG: HPr family phosphocarrier protein [Verrucomicrobia bacterium]|nr:HPr family phosphocarrier protein [bacterium]NDA09431.1 HPr family phosphocarrier protein [Verrucomicrobiota bacterium]NDA25990.1 HPr family phosphocarrier protein [Verrucomicrobiota bacterium]NDD56791.1 HPr family phosphocarrier protein [Verrucomicrobiota bacterium]NDD81395.1 HPr family phosphocarrier protein [Verrucomicrobiota bacterium]
MAAEGARHENETVIKNRLGLHARPAAMFVREANRHKCEIHVEKDGEMINGKSIMGLMMLAAGMGSKIRILATGPGAQEAVQALLQLVERKFDEE